MQKRILLLFVFCAFIFHATAQKQPHDHIKKFTFSFRSNSDLLLKEYRDNANQLNSIMDSLNKGANQKIDSIIITGSASPDGIASINEKLALSRAINLQGCLSSKFPALQNIQQQLVVAPSSWQTVIDDIKQDTSFPNQAEVISFIELHRNNPMVIKLLRENYADAYIHLNNHIIPYRRNATAYIVFYNNENNSEANPTALAEKEQKAEETQTSAVISTPIQEIVTSTPVQEIETSTPIEKVTPPNKITRKPLFAVKTNLLFDVTSLLNLEVEVPIGKHFSIAGEFIFPWWIWESKQHCLQMLSGTVEGRYWFGNMNKQQPNKQRDVMTGWFAGLYAGGGYYDLEWDRKGYQGEFFVAAGISGGYAHSIGRNLRMEYSLGFGYLQTNYKQYEARKDLDETWHLYRKLDGRYTWIGPTRAKVSLVWMINHKVKEGGMRR